MEISAVVRRVAGTAALVSAALAGFALTAWILGAWRIATFGPDYVPMARITALVILLLGVTLAWRSLRPAARGGRALTTVTAVLAGTVALLELARTAVAFRLPWDYWNQTGPKALGDIPLDRMSPLTAVAFLLTAGALLLAETSLARWAWARFISVLAAVAALLIGLVVVLGYASSTPIGYAGTASPMALLTAIAFVGLNAAVLLALGQAGPNLPGSIAPASAHRRDRAFSLTLVGVTLGVLVLLTTLGVVFLRLQNRKTRHEAFVHLDAIAHLKVDQVVQWREERLDDGRFLLRDPGLAAAISTLLADPANAAARAAVSGTLGGLQNRRIPYLAALLFDGDGNLRLSIPSNVNAAPTRSDPEFAGAAAGREVVMGDIRRDAPGEPARLDVLVPFPGPSGRAMALVVLRIDPAAQLFPLLVDDPLSDMPGDYILLRREGNEVVRLNDLPNQPGSALTWRRGISQPDVIGPALGREETAHDEAKDESGQPMFVSFRRVPDSTWIFGARVPQSAAFEAQRNEMWTTSLLVGVLLGATVLSAVYIARQRRAAILQQALRSEQERDALARRLALVTQHANDAILTIDEDQRIVDANDRALALYGYTAEEIRRLDVSKLRSPERAREVTGDFAKAIGSDGYIFETQHRHRSGATFPVEVSARPVLLDGRQHVLSVVRDISERRTHEREIDHLNRLYRALSRINQTLVQAIDESRFYQEICEILVETGTFKIAWIGRLDEATQRILPVASAGDTLGYVAGINSTVDSGQAVGRGPNGTAVREDRMYVSNDFMTDPATVPWRAAAARSGIAASICIPIRRSGRPIGALSVYAAEKNWFQAREVELLNEVAGDISYGLEVFTAREQQRATEAGLRESENRMKFLLTANPAIIFSLRAEDHRTTFISTNVREVLGYEASEFQNDPDLWSRNVHPDDLAGIAKMLDLADDHGHSGGLITREYRFRHRDGTWRWMREGTRLLYDAAGKPNEFIGYWSDVTDLHETAEKVRANEERLRLALEATHVGMYDLNLQTGVATVNDEYAVMLGYEPAGFVETVASWVARVHPDDREAAQRTLDDYLHGRLAEYRTEFRLQTRTGQWRWITSYGRLVSRTPDGRPDRMLGTHTDITARRALSEHLHKLSRTIEQAPLGVIITDLAGNIEYANARFLAMTGYTRNQVIGKNPRFLKSGDTARETYARMWETILGGGVWASEIRNRRRDGTLYPEINIIAPLLDEQGKPTHFVSFKDDITLRRRQEKEAAERLAKEKEISEMKTRFISVTSHEFRTPMAAAVGSVELLLNHFDHLAPAKRGELLTRVNSSLRRMAEMLDDVLTLNRMEANRVEVRLMALDLPRLVADAIEEIRLADRDAHRFELKVDVGDPTFTTDSNLLRHILTNLLSNAVRYSSPGTLVRLDLARGEGGMTLAVEDQGIGIPAADLHRLFQPFERGSNVGTVKGTGLGLSIVKRMVELLGGNIEVSPVAGGGSRFVLRLPGTPTLPPA